MSVSGSGNTRPRPPPGFLSRIPVSELRLIGVSVRRNNITPGSQGPIERSIDDPKAITPLIHFGRDDVRLPEHIFLQRRRSKSCSRSKSRSPRRERSRSLDYRRSSRSSSLSRKSVEEDKERRRVVDRDSNRRKSPDRKSLGCRRSIESENEKGKKRSVAPSSPGEYRPSHPDLKRRSRSRVRKNPHDRNRSHSRSRSWSRDKPKTSKKLPSPSSHKPSTSRKPSRSPRRSSLADCRSRSSPRYGDGKRDRTSRSPVKPHYSKKRRERSLSYKSPDKRRSRSPPRYDKDKPRSRSPGRSSRWYSHSPGRYDSRKSPQDKRMSRRLPHPPAVPDYAFYEGIPGSEYWIPGPIRLGFPGIPRYYQPGFYPRPIILPPRLPVVDPYQYPRHKLMVDNSRQRPRGTDLLPGDGAGSGTSTEPSAIAGTSTNSQGNVVIEEVTDAEARKNEGTDTRNIDEESRDSLHEKD